MIKARFKYLEHGGVCRFKSFKAKHY